MKNVIVIDTDKHSTSKSQVVEDFVNASRCRVAIERMVLNGFRTIDISHSLEDMAFVITNIEEPTVEQKALAKINSNLAVAGTDTDATEIMPDDVLATEDLKESSNAAIVKLADTFPVIWSKVIKRFRSLESANNSLIVDCKANLNKVQNGIDQGFKASKSTLDIFDIDETLCNALGKEEFLKVISEARTKHKDVLSMTGVECIKTISKVLKQGLGTFGRETMDTSLESFKQFDNQFKDACKKLSLEEIETSEDGLIISVFPEKDELEENTVPVVSTTAKIEIDENTLNFVWDELNINERTLSINLFLTIMLTDSNMMVAINNFNSVCKNLLVDTPVQSKVKELIEDYCYMFLKAVEDINKQISFMLYVSRFVNAYNEVLMQIFDDISSNSKTQAE